MTETDAPVRLADRYLLGAVLGEGGMAVVHQAWDGRLQRQVAVKMLRDRLVDSASRNRFDLEGRALTELNHPGLATLLDAGLYDDRPYLVLEFVDGCTLSEHYRARRLAVNEVARIGAALADTLDYVHRHGVLHRDIKPSNVLIGPDGTVKLVDFGIARLLEDTARYTATGLVMGTPGYLSPEQVRGDASTGASDVYSLALVMIEALTGEPAFHGAPDVMALARLLRRPALDPAWPDDLRELLLAMTDDSPRQRPSAGTVAVILQDLLAVDLLQRSPTPRPMARSDRPAASLAPTPDPGAPPVPEPLPDSTARPGTPASPAPSLVDATRPLRAHRATLWGAGAVAATGLVAFMAGTFVGGADRTTVVDQVSGPRPAATASLAPDSSGPLAGGAAPAASPTAPPRDTGVQQVAALGSKGTTATTQAKPKGPGKAHRGKPPGKKDQDGQGDG